MTLRRQIFFVILASFLLLTGVLYLTMKITISRSFAELETKEVLASLRRTINFFQDDLDALKTTAADWAVWDDTYAFVESPDEEYVRKNLADSTFLSLKINFMVFLDSSGRIAFARGFDLPGQKEAPVPESLKKLLTTEDFLSRHSFEAGIVMLPENPLLIAAHPILTSNQEGPARGALVLGRYLDAAAGQLAARAHLSVSIYRTDEELPSNLIAMIQKLSGGTGAFVFPLDERSVAGYGLLKDIYGKPALLVGVEVPREIHHLSKKSYLYFSLFFLAAGLLASAGIFLFVEKKYLSRLERLSTNINGIRASSSSSTRVPAQKEDELERLAAAINAMLSSLEQAYQNLQKSEDRYRTLLENSPDLILTVGNKGEITSVNQAGLAAFGYGPEEVLGRNISEFIHPEDGPLIEKTFCRAAKKKELSVRGLVFRVKKAGGESAWVELNARTSFGPDGPTETYCILRDISKRIETEELIGAITASSPVGIFVIQEGKFLSVNPQFCALTGYSENELIGSGSLHIVHPDDAPEVRKNAVKMLKKERTQPYEHRFINKNGEVRWALETVASVTYRGKRAAVGSFMDITGRKEMEEQLKYLSLHDPLTGLYNRTYFEQEMRRLEDGRQVPLGIIVCDIDGLKLVNDTLGHNKGDALLKAAATVIKKPFRKGDMVARTGGDEFAVLLPRTDRAAVEAACARIRSAVLAHNAASPELPLSISVGFAVADAAPVDMNGLLKEADNNMYREKLHRSESARSAVVRALVRALEARDYITEGHAERLEKLVVRLAAAAGLPAHKTADLRLLAQFHDIGKVGVPDRILFKPGPLTPEEKKKMQRHCEIGHRIALSAPDLAPVADLILKHHEWWNGGGYPLGLKGEEIPLECRILAIADAYDAMTSDRPYRRKLIPEEALAELKRCAGTQFDPRLVDVFLSVMKPL